MTPTTPRAPTCAGLTITPTAVKVARSSFETFDLVANKVSALVLPHHLHTVRKSIVVLILEILWVFGVVAGGMTAVANHAPFLCDMEQSNFSRLKVCARLPSDASADRVLANTTAIAGGASIVIESSLVANAHAPVVHFEEIPVAFEMQGSWTVDAKRQRIVSLNKSIDLDGPALSLAAAAPQNRGKLKYKVDASDWSGGAVGTEVLPEQLWPFMPGRLVSSHAPTKGVWREGATIWAATGLASNVSRPLGWVCDQGGDPGVWRSFSAMKNDDNQANLHAKLVRWRHDCDLCVF